VDDYTDKRVAVLGTGSSAIQIVPQVQKGLSQVLLQIRSLVNKNIVAKHLKYFMRYILTP
jgi:hypothetical protein